MLANTRHDGLFLLLLQVDHANLRVFRVEQQIYFLFIGCPPVTRWHSQATPDGTNGTIGNECFLMFNCTHVCTIVLDFVSRGQVCIRRECTASVRRVKRTRDGCQRVQ